ncbi:hypothetical protein OG225_40985 (plasmid) [Nocardia sp. NBC_01377]|uniref:hypothetical protein n=1 Tax=Nocardia sp. NBC_01377 TaxID=2903595 RepID=UPI002F90B940
MIITLVWRPADHQLLQNVSFECREDDVPVATTVSPGRAQADVSDVASSLRLTLTFKATVGTITAEVLRIEQLFKRSPLASAQLPFFDAVSYTVLTGPSRNTIDGLHPLLRGGGQSWSVGTSLVDVTGLIPVFGQQMARMAPRAGGGHLASTTRIFARTDDVLPQLWIVATPHACRGADATDVLCFLGPSQNHGTPPPLAEQFSVLATTAKLVAHGAVMFGGGTPDGGGNTPPTPRLMDRFTPGNFVLANGFEAALVASGKHAVFAIPVPANKSHNVAATAALPGLLADVHRLVVALGDAHPSSGKKLVKPQFALAAFSSGALALWGEPDPGHRGPLAPTTRRPGALRAGPDAYTDLLLFEGLDTTAHLNDLARSGSTRVVFIGYARGTVAVPFAKSKLMPKLTGRVSRLPLPSTVPGEKEPESAPLDQLKVHSPSLAHALAALAAPPALPKDLFVLKHHLCTWSGDDEGISGAPEQHFLLQALKGSKLR